MSLWSWFECLVHAYCYIALRWGSTRNCVWWYLLQDYVFFRIVLWTEDLHGNLTSYQPQTKLREGNVFTAVCLSVHRGLGLPSHNAMGQADPPQKDDPPRRMTPPRYVKPRALCILLECILVYQCSCFGFQFSLSRYVLLSSSVDFSSLRLIVEHRIKDWIVIKITTLSTYELPGNIM